MLELPYTSNIHGNAVRWGKMGDGPPLVAVHGTPFSSQVWRRIVPHIMDRRTVYYFDLVGYGLSEMREGQDVSLGVQNKVLAALFDEWELTRLMCWRMILAEQRFCGPIIWMACVMVL